MILLLVLYTFNHVNTSFTSNELLKIVLQRTIQLLSKISIQASKSKWLLNWMLTDSACVLLHGLLLIVLVLVSTLVLDIKLELHTCCIFGWAAHLLSMRALDIKLELVCTTSSFGLLLIYCTGTRCKKVNKLIRYFVAMGQYLSLRYWKGTEEISR